jgi:hypothetical protein
MFRQARLARVAQQTLRRHRI